MPKKVKNAGGAADPTADDSADKPTHNVVNTTPDPVGKDDDSDQTELNEVNEDTPEEPAEVEQGDMPGVNQDAGHVNTTENVTEGRTLEDVEGERARMRELTDKDKEQIKKEFNGPNANVQAIASKWDVEPERVFAIAEGGED